MPSVALAPHVVGSWPCTRIYRDCRRNPMQQRAVSGEHLTTCHKGRMASHLPPSEIARTCPSSTIVKNCPRQSSPRRPPIWGGGSKFVPRLHEQHECGSRRGCAAARVSPARAQLLCPRVGGLQQCPHEPKAVICRQPLWPTHRSKHWSQQRQFQRGLQSEPMHPRHCQSWCLHQKGGGCSQMLPLEIRDKCHPSSAPRHIDLATGLLSMPPEGEPRGGAAAKQRCCTALHSTAAPMHHSTAHCCMLDGRSGVRACWALHPAEGLPCRASAVAPGRARGATAAGTRC
jgi:hypothetical protein